MKKLLLLSLLLLLLTSACTTETHRYAADDPRSAQVWTPSAVVDEMAGRDPLEPFNRAMFSVNDVLMHYLVRPFSWIYGSILPKEVIKRIDYASENLAFPGRMLSCFLQAKFLGGGIVLVRFVTNSTVGIAGLFDPADAWLGLPPVKENMGKAFAFWGIGPGFILFIPLSSAITFRDQIGAAFDSVLDIKFILPYAGTVAGVNRAVNSYDGYVSAVETFSDPYDLAKMGLVAMRYINVHDYHYAPLPSGPAASAFRISPWFDIRSMQIDYRKLADAALDRIARQDAAESLAEIPPERLIRIAQYYHPQSAETDTMKFTMFNMQNNDVSWWVKSSIWNTDFVSRALHRSVSLTPDAPELPYHLWPANDEKTPAPLVILLPGVGGHHKAPQLRALAEILHGRGYSVAVLSSVFNTEFMEASRNYLPGYTPEDARQLRNALQKILEDIKTNTEVQVSGVSLAGYSMGGLHTLYLADLERQKPVLGIERFVAVNPPVDLYYALRTFDSFLERSAEWTRAEFFRQGSDAMLKTMFIASKKHPRMTPHSSAADYAVPLTRRQAAMMSGISFRLTLRDILLSAKRSNPQWQTLRTPYSWWNRNDLYREIDTFSGRRYAQECLLPEYQKKFPHATLSELNGRAGLRAIEKTLREEERIRIIHNADDPLLSRADRRFLTDALDSRIVWFDCGGHLGNLFVQEYWNEFLKNFPKVEKPVPAR